MVHSPVDFYWPECFEHFGESGSATLFTRIIQAEFTTPKRDLAHSRQVNLTLESLIDRFHESNVNLEVFNA